MKVQRWDYLHLHGDPLIRRDDGDYCASKDVARLEASHAELVAALKGMVAATDGLATKSFIERQRQAGLAAIVKAEGEGI